MCASRRSLAGLSFSPDSTSHPIPVPQGTVDKWYPVPQPEQVKCTAGLSCIPASVPLQWYLRSQVCLQSWLVLIERNALML